jgi:PAS domain S-box-containing protein
MAGDTGAVQSWLSGRPGKLMAAFICFVGLHVLYTFFHWGGDEHASLVSNVVSLVIYSGPAYFAWLTSRHPDLQSRSRRAWRFIAAANIAYGAGAALWLFYENVLAESPFPSLADIGYLAFYPLMMIGLLMLMRPMQSGEERVGFALDTVIITIAGTLVLWYFLIQPLAAAAAEEYSLTTILSLAYPVADLVLFIGIVALLLKRQTYSGTACINLVLLGTVLNFVADFFFSYQTLAGTYATGNWVDAIYTLACLPVAVGAFYRYRLGRRGYETERLDMPLKRIFSKALPYAAVAIGYGVLIAVEYYNRDIAFPGFDIVCGSVITTLILARQFMFVRENLKANNALSELQERVKGLYDAASDGIVISDFDGKVLETNDAFNRMLGYQQDELTRTVSVYDLTASEDLEATRTTFETVARKGRPVEYEKEYLRKDGSRFTAHATVFPIRSSDGSSSTVAAIVRDITEKKRTEKLLVEAEERWKLALRVNRDGIWDWDLVAGTCYYSPRWREMFGFGVADEITISPASAAEFFHPDDKPLAERIRSAVRGGALPYFDIEFRHICKDGSYKWVRCRGEAVRDADTGRLERVLGLNTDITERKRSELEREAIGQIVRGVSETSNLDELLELIHRAIGMVTYAENCFVALYDKQTSTFDMSFFVDQYDKWPEATDLSGTRSEFVFRSGNPLLLDPITTERYEKEGKFRLVGTPPVSWLGAPLRTPNEIIGVLVVQSYEEQHTYTQRDLQFLSSVAGPIALAIERKVNEEALISREMQLREAQRIAHIGSWELDLTTNQVIWSDELFEIFGLKLGEVTPSFEYLLSVSRLEDRERLELAVAQALNSRSVINIDHQITRKDGAVRDLHSDGELVVDSDGRPVRMLGTAQDVTEQKKAERHMRLLTTALESTANGVLITDSNGNIEWVNPAFTKLTGYDSAEAVGKNPRLLKSGENSPETYADMWATIKTGNVWHGELINRRKDGTFYNEELSITPVTEQSGSIGHFIAIKKDITLRKAAEEALKISEGQHRLLFDSNPFPVYVYDLETLRFLAVNKAAITHYGYSKEEFLDGLTLKDLRPAGDIPELLNRVSRVVKGGSTVARPSRHCKRDGTELWVEITSHYLEFAGQPAEIVLVNDITKRKLAEKELARLNLELRKQQQQLNDILENAPCVIWESSIDSKTGIGHSDFVSNYISTLHGYTVDEWRSDPEFWLKTMYPDDREIAFAAHKKLLADGSVTTQTRWFRKDGRLIWVETHMVVIRDAEGNTVGVRGVATDITDRKTAEDRLRIFNERLQQSNRELQEFAYVASHDLQEPLRKVQTFADRLNSKYADRLDETGKDYLVRMRNAAARMQILIQDLLSFSRVTTKAQPFVEVDLAQITEDVLSDLEVKIEETEAQIDIVDLPKVYADPSQMRQLIQNLVGNALKFRKPEVKPHITISAKNGTSNGSGPLYTVSVEDNGIGFEEKYTDKIFTVFQRLHGRAEYEGSGIGLAVCRKIVERHHGTITAKSRPGSGSKFTFTLPAKQPAAEA